MSPPARGRWRRLVERLHERVEEVAAHGEIDAAPPRAVDGAALVGPTAALHVLVEMDRHARPAAHVLKPPRCIEPTRRDEHRVSDRLRIEAPHGGRVPRGRRHFARVRSSAIGAREDDLADERLECRAARELEREVIEQFRAPRRSAELAEVVGRLDDAASHQLEPDAVRKRAPEKGRVARGESLRECEAPASLERGVGRLREVDEPREDRHARARRGFARRTGRTAQVDGLVEGAALLGDKRADRRLRRTQRVARRERGDAKVLDAGLPEARRVGHPRRVGVFAPGLLRWMRSIVARHDRVDLDPAVAVVDELEIGALAREAHEIEGLDAPRGVARVDRGSVARLDAPAHSLEEKRVALVEPVVPDDDAHPRGVAAQPHIEIALRHIERGRPRAADEREVEARAVDGAGRSDAQRAIGRKRQRSTRRSERMARAAPLRATLVRVVDQREGVRTLGRLPRIVRGRNSRDARNLASLDERAPRSLDERPGTLVCVDESLDAARVARDAREREEVLRGNRVELVVVAARARDGEAEERPPRDIDLPSDAVRLVESDIDGRVGRRPEEPPRRADGRCVRKPKRWPCLEQVACDLLRDEPRGCQVCVERLDHIVAVAPCARNVVVELVAEALRIAREIEPVPPPTLAERRARERSIDERRERSVARFARGNRRECARLLFAWRKPAQVEARAAKKRHSVDVRGRGETMALARRKDEAVDVAARPALVLHSRGRGRPHRFERPRRRVLGARLDPAANRVDLGRGERLAPIGRHEFVGVGVRDARQDLACGGVAGGDRAKAALQDGGRPLEGVEAQARRTRLRIGPVAGEALRSEDRPHVSVVVRRVHRAWRGGHRDAKRGDHAGRADSRRARWHSRSMTARAAARKREAGAIAKISRATQREARAWPRTRDPRSVPDRTCRSCGRARADS